MNRRRTPSAITPLGFTCFRIAGDRAIRVTNSRNSMRVFAARAAKSF